MLPTFRIARLNCYTPKFSGVPQKLTWCQQFGLQVLPKWGDANIWPLKKAVFRCFFGLKKFSQTFAYSMSYIFGKLWHSAIIWPIRKSFQCIPQGVRFLLAKQTWLSGTSDNESYIPDKQLLRLSGLSKGNVIYLLLSPKTLCLRVRQIFTKDQPGRTLISDLKFVKHFTRPYFCAKNFTHFKCVNRD